MRFLITFLTMILTWQSGFSNVIDHSAFDSLLQKYVKDGLVNYKELKENQKLLTGYLDYLGSFESGEFLKFSRNEQMAYWINAYNAITIEGILRNYPIKKGEKVGRAIFPGNSILQISGFWDQVFVKLMEKDITLNQIEHDILRKKFQDPRIHFVIVCASIGCPVLESRAFFAENLDQRLEKAASNFINDTLKVKLDIEKDTICLSSIFKWYKGDFAVSEQNKNVLRKYQKNERGVIDYILNYLPPDDRKYIFEKQPKIKYLKYDWSLNEQK